jgi:hypothetical protein
MMRAIYRTAEYGDPAFVPNVTELQRYYLSAPVIQEIRDKIVNVSVLVRTGRGYDC